MNRHLAWFFGAAFLTAAPLPAADQLVVIGDSLSKEYEITYPGVPAAGVDGIDPANPSARNWSEILNVQRNASFDLGFFKNSLIDRWPDLRLLGHEYNWAVPGAKAREIRNLLTGQNLSEITAGASFRQLLAFAPDWAMTPAGVTVQLQTSAEGAVIFCGANDLRFGNADPAAASSGTAINYGTIYGGDGTGAGNPQPLMDSLKSSIQAAGNFVRTANPTIPLAICAVPHVGGTPDVKATWPTDAVKTGRITTALDALNAELRTWTEGTLGAAWVEAPATLTKRLIDDTLVIGGVAFFAEPDPLTAAAAPAAHNRYLFASDGFHASTAPHGLIAQAIQAALRARFPARYGASVPLTDRDVVVTICGIPAATGFTEFMTAASGPANLRAALDDPDGDGVPNLMEFALAGLAPTVSDNSLLPSAELDHSGAAPAIALTWTPRFENNIYCTLVCQQSPDMQAGSWAEVPAAQITLNADGSHTARVSPGSPGAVFLRLEAVVTP